MLPQILCKYLGTDWKTDIASYIFTICGIVSLNPGHVFDGHQALLDLAQYFAVGAGAAGLKAARDSRRTPLLCAADTAPAVKT